VVRFPELAEGGDVSDFINTRLNAGTDTAAIKNELAPRFRAAPEWEPKLEAEPTAPKTEAPWPVLAEDAYHGLAGDIVRTIKPHSESDPVAILVQVLTVAGNIMGRTAYYQVESDRHHPNLFSILVGESSKARKGTSYGRVRAIAKVADELWADNRTKGGLSSGEGFISEVRDAQVRWDQKAKEWEEVDPGITDKRLTIIEPEFAGALAVMERHGNTLSPLIRRGWDGDTLSTMTRNNPLKATGAHISIIGHITDTELKARLTHAANGFANRFLFVLVKRSKLLPFGGDLTDSEILGLGELLKKALVRLPAEPTRITMTDSAKKVWATVYGSLSEGKPGLLGAVTARAEAQVIRMAMIYALLDGERQIDEAHLRAGLAVWEYCEASATHIFGNASGDPVVDELLAALRQAGDAGMTRSLIRDFFGRHRTGDRIAGALGTLLGRGLARCDVSATGGRPTETWVATKAT
jgi:hypothetical protein